MTEARFSYTTKIRGDLLTVRGDSAQEFKNNLDAFLFNNDILDQINNVHEVAQTYGNGATPAAAPAAAPTVTVDQAAATVAAAFNAAAPAAAPAAGPQAVEQQTDKWGKLYTKGLPNAPVVPNGPMLLLEAKSKAGKPYKCWVDPLEGPWPVRKVTEKADRQWIDS